MEQSFFDGKVKSCHFRGFEDSRGLLVPIDFEAIGWRPMRTFLVKGRDGATRGGHAHQYGQQLLVRVSGEIQVDLSLGGRELTLSLGPDSNAVMIAAPVWASQTYRGREPGLLVFSDYPFAPSEYLVDPV